MFRLTSRQKLCKAVIAIMMILVFGLPETYFAKAAGDKTLNVKDFKGVGSVAIQKAIDACPSGGTVYIPAGTYPIVTTITLKSGITITGDGSATILKVDSLLSKTSPVMKNPSAPTQKDVYGEKNITIKNITFSGENISGRTAGLLSLTKAQDITIEGCTFKYNQHITLGLGGCKNVLVKKCVFLGNGLPKPSKTSTPALWTDAVYDTYSSNIVVDNCYFKDNNWSGCYFMPKGGKVVRCVFINNGESTIFTNGNGSDIQYVDNYIDGARSSNISASGIETEASNSVIEGNLIKNSGDAGISLTNLKNFVVKNNMILNNGQEVEKFRSPGIAILSLPVNEKTCPPQDITITGNVIANRTGMESTQTAAVGIWKHDSGQKVERITISNNIFSVFPSPVRVVSNYSDTIGPGYNVFANQENITITEKNEEKFVKELEERVVKAGGVFWLTSPPKDQPNPDNNITNTSTGGSNSQKTAQNTNPNTSNRDPKSGNSNSNNKTTVSNSPDESKDFSGSPDNSEGTNPSSSKEVSGGKNKKSKGINPLFIILPLLIIAAGAIAVGVDFYLLKTRKSNQIVDNDNNDDIPTNNSPEEDQNE